MMWIESLLLYMFNLAVASLLCTSISLIAANLFRSLPKRHASLVMGLSICLVAPVLVGFSGLFSLGVLPTLSIDDFSSAEHTLAPPVAQPLTIGSREKPPILPVTAPSSTDTIREQPYTSTSSVAARQDLDSKESTKDSTVMRSETGLPNQGQSTMAWVGGISVLGWIAGILTMVVCRMRGMNEFQTVTQTDVEGKYELEVAPNHNYLVTATHEGRVSAPHTGLVVYPNMPQENRNFELRNPTRVHGRLIHERTQQPIPNARVIVYHYGTELMDIPDANIPNPENERWSVQPIIGHSATTDGDGKFEFMLGDGSFDLRPPQQEKTANFEIHGQSELEFTVTTQVHSEVELLGLVVAKTDGLPIKAARVEGVPRNFGSMYWTATADDEGKFRVLRRQEPTYVLAKNEDKTLASIVEVGDLNRTFIIQLESVGNARGRLVNSDGQPIVGQRIHFSVDVPDVDNDTFSPRFGGHVVTEDNGEFRLESLVANWEYKITFPSTPEGTIPRLTSVTVKPGESVELGDLTEPALYKPYVPPTLDEQIKSAFEVEGTPLERNQRALQKVQLVNQHLLIVFGQPNDPRIHRLMEIRYKDDDFRSLSDDYRFMAIPTDVERLPNAQALARVLGQVLNEASQPFYLVLLDAEGKAVATAGDAELCVSSELSKDLLFEFLQHHQTQPLDARQLLDDALLRATQENKRVLVQETATWCGPCHLLSEFLDANRSWEKDYIWIKMDHRWEGAQEIMVEFRDGAEGGIPWFVILDAQGKKLTTSNDPLTGKNIGFPSTPSGRKHFANMLNTSRQRMTESDVQALVDAIDSQE